MPFLSFRLRPMILASLIEKGLGSSRAGTRIKTLEILFEIIAADTAEPVITELGNFTLNKQIKLACAAVNAVTDIIR